MFPAPSTVKRFIDEYLTHWSTLGAWSQWEPWPAECDVECKRTRRRKCIAPSPRNGGRPCEGSSVDVVSCSNATTGLAASPNCVTASRSSPNPQRGLTAVSNTINTMGPSTVDSSQIYVLASLGCVALLLAVIIGLIAVLFCRRRRLCVGGKDEPMYLPVNNGKTLGVCVPYIPNAYSGNVRTVLLTQPHGLLGDFSHNEKLPRNSPYPQFATLNPAVVNGLNTYTLRSARSYASGYSTNRRAAGNRALVCLAKRIFQDHESR